MAEAMVPHLAGIENLVEREEYTKKVAQSLNLEQHLIKTQVQQLRRGQERGSRSQKTGPKAKRSLLPAAHRAEIGALLGLGSLFLNCPETRVTIAESISKDWLSSLPQAVVMRAMLTLFEQGGSDFLCPASRIGCQIRAHVMLWPSWQFNRCRLVTRQF